MSKQISHIMKIEATLRDVIAEVHLLKDISRRQHSFIQELFELKSTAASKAELHAAVFSLRSSGDRSTPFNGKGGLATTEDVNTVIEDVRLLRNFIQESDMRSKDALNVLNVRLNDVESKIEDSKTSATDQSSDDDIRKELRCALANIRRLESSVESCKKSIAVVVETTSSLPPRCIDADALQLQAKVENLEACLKQHVDMFQELKATRSSNQVYRGYSRSDTGCSFASERTTPSCSPSARKTKGNHFRIGGSFSNIYKHNEAIAAPPGSAPDTVSFVGAGSFALQSAQTNADKSSRNNIDVDPSTATVEGGRRRCADGTVHLDGPSKRAVPDSLANSPSLMSDSNVTSRPSTASGLIGTFSTRRSRLVSSAQHHRPMTGFVLEDNNSDFSHDIWGVDASAVTPNLRSDQSRAGE